MKPLSGHWSTTVNLWSRFFYLHDLRQGVVLNHARNTMVFNNNNNKVLSLKFVVVNFTIFFVLFMPVIEKPQKLNTGMEMKSRNLKSLPRTFWESPRSQEGHHPFSVWDRAATFSSWNDGFLAYETLQIQAELDSDWYRTMQQHRYQHQPPKTKSDSLTLQHCFKNRFKSELQSSCKYTWSYLTVDATPEKKIWLGQLAVLDRKALPGCC